MVQLWLSKPFPQVCKAGRRAADLLSLHQGLHGLEQHHNIYGLETCREQSRGWDLAIGLAVKVCGTEQASAAYTGTTFLILATIVSFPVNPCNAHLLIHSLNKNLIKCLLYAN